MKNFSSWVSRLASCKPPDVPAGSCIYAVGDIHGRLDLLQKLLERIWADAPDAKNSLVFVGDYIDRGPASKDVIDLLIQLERPGWDVVRLRGNHEQVLLDYLDHPETYPLWRNFGGAETLLSYGVRPPLSSDQEELQRTHKAFTAALPTPHYAFLSALPYSHVIGDYFFVHAGVHPAIALERQLPEDMLWIRDEFLCSDASFGKIVVHGHTPGGVPVVRPNRICIDTGAYATNQLTAAKITRKACIFLSTGDS